MSAIPCLWPWVTISALTTAVLLVVQASGEISVHAQLVRVHIDISPGGPLRALAGAQGVRLGTSLTARTLGPVPVDRRQNGSAQSEVLVYRGGHHGPISFGPPETPMARALRGRAPACHARLRAGVLMSEHSHPGSPYACCGRARSPRSGTIYR
jgi:hypothetical protein